MGFQFLPQEAILGLLCDQHIHTLAIVMHTMADGRLYCLYVHKYFGTQRWEIGTTVNWHLMRLFKMTMAQTTFNDTLEVGVFVVGSRCFGGRRLGWGVGKLVCFSMFGFNYYI